MAASLTRSPEPQRGDEAELFHLHAPHLERVVVRRVNTSHAVVQDACSFAWMQLIRRQLRRATVFAWLCAVAIREAVRLDRIARHDISIDELGVSEEFVCGFTTLDDTLEARRGLAMLAALPKRQRQYLSLLVAGFGYREIGEIAGGRTYTNGILSWRCRLWLDARSHRR